MLLLYTYCLYAWTLSSFFYTFIGSLSDDLRFVRPDIGCLFHWSGVDELVHFARSLEFSLLITGILISLLFLLFLDSPYIIISCHSISVFIYHHVWTFICSIAVIMICYSRFITCSDYLKLRAYTWGIFLTYMRRRLSSHLRSSVFWEAWRDRIFFIRVRFKIKRTDSY